MNQLLEFSKYGVNAIRIFWYIRMQEGKLVSAGELLPKEHTFIKLDGVTISASVSRIWIGPRHFISMYLASRCRRYQEKIRHSMLDAGTTKLLYFESSTWIMKARLPA